VMAMQISAVKCLVDMGLDQEDYRAWMALAATTVGHSLVFSMGGVLGGMPLLMLLIGIFSCAVAVSDALTRMNYVGVSKAP
jgi:hypothetical protein